MVVKVYVSGISGNKEVKKRQQRVLMILDSKSIKYEVLDITEPGRENDKDFMQNNSKSNGGTVSDPNPRSPLPPQIFNDDEYCGDYDKFDLANEVDTLEQFLKVEIPTPDPVQVENGMDQVHNGSEEKETSETRSGERSKEATPARESTPLNEATKSREATPAKDASKSREATPAKEASKSREATPAKDATKSREATPAKEPTSKDGSVEKDVTKERQKSVEREATPPKNELKDETPEESKETLKEPTPEPKEIEKKVTENDAETPQEHDKVPESIQDPSVALIESEKSVANE